MSYSQVSHVAHETYPPIDGPGPAGMYQAPPPPPRPGFEQQVFGGGPPVGGPGYQSYFGGNYPPPTHIHHSGPIRPFQSYDYSYDNRCSSLLRTCLAALCCCCVMEECCPIF